MASDRKLALRKALADPSWGGDPARQVSLDLVGGLRSGSREQRDLARLLLLRLAAETPQEAANAMSPFCLGNAPLARARALRTLGYTLHLPAGPVVVALADSDDYVRKTAAMCVAKMRAMRPGVVVSLGLLGRLRYLMDDPSPAVVSNTVAVLSELSPAEGLTPHGARKLLSVLDRCNEWGRVYVLDALGGYSPADEEEAREIRRVVAPQLSHKNSAVVVSAAKVLLGPTRSDEDPELGGRIARALVAFLSSEPEVQFAVLQSIREFARERPGLFAREVGSFLVRRDDPACVKLGKLDVLGRLAREGDSRLVLAELRTQIFDPDPEVARASVEALGRCAALDGGCAPECLRILQDLARLGDEHVAQEAVVALARVLLTRPGSHAAAAVVAAVCEDLPRLTRADAKASYAWLVGEYAELVPDPGDWLDDFLEGFLLEDPPVQLQLLTAAVKVRLKGLDASRHLAARAVDMCASEVGNPDVRDRGVFYQRLLSAGAGLARQVVLRREPGADEASKDSLVDVDYEALT
ncbi:AP-2 complex subunit beta-like [Bacillus rossius redtenbacheri]|uniref:AP-2 complex subunit beta-like n=1 Tax=Bacillus rossius redtenbacheri TaxID=93214 RepID=UPI002FDEAA67